MSNLNFPPPSIDPFAPPGIDPVAQFYRDLFAATRRTWVSRAILAANVLIFLLMGATHPKAFYNPDNDLLIRWGANYAPLTNNGQPWRLLTCMFLHAGLLHVACNMYVLWVAGPFIEQLFGNLAFAVLYLFAGLVGSVASDGWHPAVTSVGASGAIFGIFGGLLGYLAVQRTRIPPSVLRGLGKWGLMFVVLNVVIGTGQKQIDMAAHIGGLAGGLVAGALLARPIGEAGVRSRTARAALFAAVAAVGMGLVVAKLPKAIDVDEIVAQFWDKDDAADTAYLAARERWQDKKLTDAQFADALRDQALDPYKSAVDLADKLRSARGVPQPAGKNLSDYAHLRYGAWATMADALRAGNQKTFDQSDEIEGLADVRRGQLLPGRPR